MAHNSQQRFFRRVSRIFPQHFTDVRVLEVGSLDINGNLRHLFLPPVWYTGIDLAPGPNVDLVAPGHLFDAGIRYDTVLSAEALEHDLYYPRTLQNLVRLLLPGGLLVISCATTGRPEHGTRRSLPENAPFLGRISPEWGDYYRNLDESDFRSALDLETCFSNFRFEIEPHAHDLYFWGMKRT